MVNNLTDLEFRAYFAGLMDSDGCFSIPISIRKTSRNLDYIAVHPQLRIGWKQNSEKYLLAIHERLGVGKIYYSNKDKPDGVIYWQTTNWHDAVTVCEFIKEYIFLKKRQCDEMLELGKKWLEVNKVYRKNKPKELILEIARVSCNLNSDIRLTSRYRDVKNYGYWEKKISAVYKNLAIAPLPNKGGIPPKYPEEQILADVRAILSEGYSYNKHRKMKRRAEYRFGSWEKAVELANRNI